MKITKQSRRNGLFVQADDLEVGKYYAVHSEKDCPDQPIPVAGVAFKLLAMNFPFVVGKIAAEPSQSSVTFDVRFLNFMRVTDEFVQAQQPEPANDLFKKKG